MNTELTKTPLLKALCAAVAVLALASAIQPAAAQGVFQTADVVEFGPGASSPPDFTGAAWLNRTADRVQGRLMSKVGKAGFAYTVWLVIFNNPSACQVADENDPGCNDADLFDPAVRGSVYYGNSAISALAPPGAVINVDLSMRADGMLPEGRFSLDDAIDGEPFVDGLDPGNGLCAEIHLVVDEHQGPVKTDAESWVLDLTTTDFPDPALQTTERLGAAAHRVAVFPPADFGPQCEDPHA